MTPRKWEVGVGFTQAIFLPTLFVYEMQMSLGSTCQLQASRQSISPDRDIHLSFIILWTFTPKKERWIVLGLIKLIGGKM